MAYCNFQWSCTSAQSANSLAQANLSTECLHKKNKASNYLARSCKTAKTGAWAPTLVKILLDFSRAIAGRVDDLVEDKRTLAGYLNLCAACVDYSASKDIALHSCWRQEVVQYMGLRRRTGLMRFILDWSVGLLVLSN